MAQPEKNERVKTRSVDSKRSREAAEVARNTLEAERTRLTELRPLDSEELATLLELRDASSTLDDDLQAARGDAHRIGVELADEKRARAAAETREAKIPTPSTSSGEALDRLKTELVESQGRVRRLTVELANEKKKVKVPPYRTPVARPTRAAMDALTDERDAVATERDSLAAERDLLQGLLDTRGTQITQLSENLGAVTEEFVQTRSRATLREDQLTHQHQLTNWKWTHFSTFQD